MSLPSPVVLEKVSFAYGKLPILQDITFSCEQGQTIGLLGGSGSGKTTILNLISGLIEPNSGSVHVEGRPSWEAVGQKRVGYLLQRPTLFPWLSVLENVALPLLSAMEGCRGLIPFVVFHEAKMSAQCWHCEMRKYRGSRTDTQMNYRVACKLGSLWPARLLPILQFSFSTSPSVHLMIGFAANSIVMFKL